MDLGIAGRKALVCASSQGLGKACAMALASEGCAVWINGRDEGRLKAAADDIATATGAKVTPVVGDINTPEGRDRLIAACPDADILINNNEGPPPGKLEDWDHDAWIGAFEQNMLPAILLIRALMPGMRQRRFGRIINITSQMVKAPGGQMGLSTAARAGLTAVCKAISRESVVDNVTINNVLPYLIDSGRQKFLRERAARLQNITVEEARARQENNVAAKRMGTPEEFGAACAFLCSAQAGYICGQNLQLDGGTYAGLV